jgi:hypothetical protein
MAALTLMGAIQIAVAVAVQEALASTQAQV